MLALAVVLIHEPELLMIDELSLGLAPLVVQRLLERRRGAQGAGQTMIIVEQSLNVALAVADRADLPREGAGPVRGADRRSSSSATTSPGRCSSATEGG